MRGAILVAVLLSGILPYPVTRSVQKLDPIAVAVSCTMA
jgi:hypothetical protein